MWPSTCTPACRLSPTEPRQGQPRGRGKECWAAPAGGWEGQGKLASLARLSLSPRTRTRTSTAVCQRWPHFATTMSQPSRGARLPHRDVAEGSWGWGDSVGAPVQCPALKGVNRELPGVRLAALPLRRQAPLLSPEPQTAGCPHKHKDPARSEGQACLEGSGGPEPEGGHGGGWVSPPEEGHGCGTSSRSCSGQGHRAMLRARGRGTATGSSGQTHGSGR